MVGKEPQSRLNSGSHMHMQPHTWTPVRAHTHTHTHKFINLSINYTINPLFYLGEVALFLGLSTLSLNGHSNTDLMGVL